MLRETINAHPLLQAAVKSNAGQHAIQTSRACRAVQPAGKFAIRQLATGVGAYRLRGNGHTVHVRHRTRDVAILAEIFSRHSYQPPASMNGHLDGPLNVLDLGGNVGLFGAYALHTWNVTELVSYEPDHNNLELLRATARPHMNWTVSPVAVSNRNGSIRFLEGAYSESREALPFETGGTTVPVVDVFDHKGTDLVKMDIEGGEWPILADPRLPDLARVIVLEWHAVGAPDEYHAGDVARRLLREAGYTEQYEPSRDHDGNGVLWAWKP